MQHILEPGQIMVRINGVLPEITRLSNSELSERAMEIRGTGEETATSCSVFTLIEGNDRKKFFQLLIDIGPGVVSSLQQISESEIIPDRTSYLPDALLVTHSHEDHVMDLPLLLKLYSTSRKLRIICTADTKAQLLKKFPTANINSLVEFVEISPGHGISIGPFVVTALSVIHFDYNEKSSLPGCVIYVVEINNTKVVMGWDFLAINDDIDQKLLWNPDLLILGTETYNNHPSTGMISVGDAITLSRRWNARCSFIVHYSGLLDFEDEKNQWFRGPVKPMASDLLQHTIDEQLKISGDDRKFRITVAKEGMIWKSNKNNHQLLEDNFQVENPIEVESLQKYILQMEKREPENKLNLMIEDRVNRYMLEFDNPARDKTNENVIYGESVKGMLTKGPKLKMQINSQSASDSTVHIEVLKGKKFMFKDDITISDTDAKRIKKFIHECFAPR